MDLGGSEGGGNGEGVVVRVEDVKGALREVRPSAMREVTVEVPMVSSLLATDIYSKMWHVIGFVDRHWRTR